MDTDLPPLPENDPFEDIYAEAILRDQRLMDYANGVVRVVAETRLAREMLVSCEVLARKLGITIPD